MGGWKKESCITRSLMLYPAQQVVGDQMQEVEMGRACGMHGKEMRKATIMVGKLRGERHHFKDLCVVLRIIFSCS